MKALDGRKLHDALRRKPIEKLDGRTRAGAARVAIANLGDELFEEAIGGAGARRGDKGGSV